LPRCGPTPFPEPDPPGSETRVPLTPHRGASSGRRDSSAAHPRPPAGEGTQQYKKLECLL